MKAHRVMRISLLLALVCATASCGWLPAQLSDTGIEVKPLATEHGHVASAGFWSEGENVVLRGEVVSRPASKLPLPGHVHAVVILPDGTTKQCLRAKQRMATFKVRKFYDFQFREKPSPNTVVEILYHEHALDHDC